MRRRGGRAREMQPIGLEHLVHPLTGGHEPRACGPDDEDRVELIDEPEDELAWRAGEDLLGRRHRRRRRQVVPHERQRALNVAEAVARATASVEARDAHARPQPLEHQAERVAVRKDVVQVDGAARPRHERVDPPEQDVHRQPLHGMSDRQVAADGAFGGKHEGTDDLSLRDKRRQEELMLVWSCEGSQSIYWLSQVLGSRGYLPHF